MDAAAGPRQAVLAVGALVVAAAVVLGAVGGCQSWKQRRRCGGVASETSLRQTPLTLVTVPPLVSMVTAAGVGLVQVHTRSVDTPVGHTLVPI